MTNALIVGGTGQIGLGVATRLASEGWHVTIASRNPMQDTDLNPHSNKFVARA